MLKLFEEVTDVSKDGNVDENEAEALLKTASTVEADMLAFSSNFRSVSASLADESFVARHKAFKDEYHVVFVFCTMARLLVDLAKKYAKREEIQRSSVLAILGNNIRNIFAGMFDESHQDFAYRNSLSLLLCFFLGYIGNGSLIPPYTADIATNASLLLSNFVGSALQKNMGRVQGLVIGSVVGRVIHALLSMSDCDGAFYGVSMVITLGVFSLVSFYIFMSSETFGFTAYLFGGFGSMVILGDCSETENTASAYLAIVCATLCIIIMAGVDMALAPSAAEDAEEAYLGHLRSMRDGVVSMLKLEELPKGYSVDALGDMLVSTRRSAEEAAKAPSMVAKPFRPELFHELVNTSRTNLIHTAILEKAVFVQPDTRTPDATPREYLNGSSPVIEILKRCKSYKDVSASLEEVMLAAFLLAETSIKADTSLEAIHATKDIKMKVNNLNGLLDQLAIEVGFETDGKFKETLIPLDQDTDTALQVTFKELQLIIQKCRAVKTHSMTHV